MFSPLNFGHFASAITHFKAKENLVYLERGDLNAKKIIMTYL